MAGNDAGDDVREVGLRLDADQLAGLDEGGKDGPVLGAAVGTGEEGVLAGERERADRTLDDVGVDLDPAVVKEAAQPCPAGERVADRVGELSRVATARTPRRGYGYAPGAPPVALRPSARGSRPRSCRAPRYGRAPPTRSAPGRPGRARRSGGAPATSRRRGGPRPAPPAPFSRPNPPP